MKHIGFIHRFIAGKPGENFPALLLLHGTGGDEQDLISVGQSLLPGAALLSPRGKILENGMPRFFRRLAEGVFDIDDLKRRTHELADFIAVARREYSINWGIVAVGYSNGANIAASLMLLHPGVLAGGVLFRPMVPFVPEEAPPRLDGTHILLAAGRTDPIVPPDQTAELASILKKAGVAVSIHWHNGGHQIGQDDINAARRWLQEYLR